MKEEDEEEVAVADADAEDGINKIISSIKISILIRLFNKVHNSNNISQELSTDTAGHMEHVDTLQTYVMHQLRDIVMMRLWKIV